VSYMDHWRAPQTIREPQRPVEAEQQLVQIE
jgi:hypothetical protein